MSPATSQTNKKALIKTSASNFDFDTFISLDGARHAEIVLQSLVASGNLEKAPSADSFAAITTNVATPLERAALSSLSGSQGELPK
jgi:hypothetical protein